MIIMVSRCCSRWQSTKREERACIASLALHKSAFLLNWLQDEVHVSFENIIDLSQFTLRVAEKDAERLPEVRCHAGVGHVGSRQPPGLRSPQLRLGSVEQLNKSSAPHRIHQILAAVSEERRKEMQLNLAKVWHR